MADLSQVEDALVSVASTALYPNGTSSPSVIGVDCRVYRGWPMAAALDADLRAGKLNVSVYAQPSVERNTTRFPTDWQTLTPAAPQITLSVSGQTVTVGGAIQTGDVATIKTGARKAYSVAVQANSTLAGIASSLAALIAVDIAASAVGAVVTVPGGGVLSVAIGGTGIVWRELRRQAKGFQVIVWASTPAQRDLASAAIDKAFALVEVAGFLALADGSAAHLTYVLSRETDAPQKELLYRRDLFYSVEYPTTDTQAATSITAIVENVKGGPVPPDAPAVTTIQ
jgi:hypothetical protein